MFFGLSGEPARPIGRSGKLGEINFLSLLDPLLECPESSGGDGELYGTSGGGIDQRLFLQIWFERAIRRTLGVADVVSRRRPFAGDCAGVCHTRGKIPSHGTGVKGVGSSFLPQRIENQNHDHGKLCCLILFILCNKFQEGLIECVYQRRTLQWAH
ncbi:MAG: hypothetical protein UY82_C0025G0006 [Candidatus Uhrbacteria bacterium GW2011_GWC2_53_7]|uniref:Uncharacterized protein n=1 Tax=Candidatus Uhrbacteria bacterium GW2011_GWC2_53_7 TaxID=1618986 RepID=A0A0G1XZV1_9BACT|nr:MAG: hypothetical protein UY82_C0025G0006 [Candidatus Uhrbacteria bacterium GW2011_GWC2_53_7]